MDLEQYGWMDRLLYRIERGLSRFADLIIVNSQSGFDYAVAHGFPRKRMVVIHNGIDVERFRPDLEARHRWRKDWGIAQTDVLVGLVGRIDPMKGHETFLRAGALLAKERDNVRFVCVGDGSSAFRRTLQSLSEHLGLHKRLMWIDSCSDLVEMYNAMDVVTSSSSFGEGFSNVIGEAMACGVPCVVTNVGDSAMIVGDTGQVVSPKNPQALAAGWDRLLDRLRLECNLNAQARTRIIQHFRIDKLVETTHDVLIRLEHTRCHF